MKINELINEAMPYGFGNYLKHQIRAGIPFGAGGRAKAMGQSQTGLMANKTFQEFHQWLGTFDGQATLPNLVHYLKGKRFDVEELEARSRTYPKDKVLNDKQVGGVISDLLKKRLAPKQPTATPAPTKTKPVATQQPATQGSMINADGSITIAGAKGAAPSKIMPTDPLYKSMLAALQKSQGTTTPAATPTAKPRYKLGADGQRIRIN